MGNLPVTLHRARLFRRSSFLPRTTTKCRRTWNLGLARIWARLERAGILIVLLVIFILPRVIGIDPVGQALGRILPWAFRTMFWLAGHNVDGLDGNFI